MNGISIFSHNFYDIDKSINNTFVLYFIGQLYNFREKVKSATNDELFFINLSKAFNCSLFIFFEVLQKRKI